ncbi:MAG: transposase [Acidobacteriota bacterium]
MGTLDYKQFSRRHRPHIHPDAILFVTYRLAGSVSKAVVSQYKAQKEWLESEVRRLEQNGDKLKLVEQVEQFQRDWFLKFEAILDKAEHGPMWMQNACVTEKVGQSLHRLDGDAYRLDAFSVMSNHVHVLFKALLSERELREVTDQTGHLAFASEHPSLSRIMHLLKGRSARECNLILGRSGSFWEHESFDHVVRSGKFQKTLRYILNNPVKAGLVNDWRKWPGNYCRTELVELMSDKLQFVAAAQG